MKVIFGIIKRFFDILGINLFVLSSAIADKKYVSKSTKVVRCFSRFTISENQVSKMQKYDNYLDIN